MRQRGAGYSTYPPYCFNFTNCCRSARDFHDLSFDLSLPNALRSASNTPAQVRGATPRTRPSIHKTPSPTPLAYVAEEQSDTVARPQYITPLQRRGRLNQGPASGRLQYITPRVVITRADEEGSAVKRRRVTESFDTVPAQVLPDIPEEEGIDLHKPGIEEEEEARQVSPFSVKKKRKRRSILLKSKRRSRGSLESATSHDETIVIELDDETRGDEDEEIETVTEYPDPLVRAEAAQKAGEDSVDEAENEDDEPEGEVELDVTEQVEDWPIPTTRVSGRARKKKRKSLGLPSKKRQRSSVMQRVALRDTHLTNTNTDEESEDLEQGDQSDEEARMRAPSMKNKKGRPGESPPDDGPTSSVASKRLQQPRPDGGGLKKGNNSEKAPTQSSRSSRKGRTTSPTRQRISASRADAAPIRQKDGEKQSSQVKRHSSKDRSEDNKLEIRVQRMSHFHRLNFNPEEDDDLAGPSDFPNKKTPNAIDVLAQICREIIGKNIQALKNRAERERGAKRAEWMRKMEVVKRFGDELEGRLLMMVGLNSL